MGVGAYVYLPLSSLQPLAPAVLPCPFLSPFCVRRCFPLRFPFVYLYVYVCTLLYLVRFISTLFSRLYLACSNPTTIELETLERLPFVSTSACANRMCERE